MNKTPGVDAVPNFQLDPPEISDEFHQTQAENVPEKVEKPPSTARRLDDDNLELSDQDYLLKNESKNTKTSTKYAVKTFNSVMESLAQKDPAGNWLPLEKVSDEDLPLVLAKFLKLVVKPDGSKYNASSLSTMFASLVRHIAVTREIDVKRDVKFKTVLSILRDRCTESAKDGQRPGINKSSSVKPEDVKKAVDSGNMGRSNPDALLATVQFQLMVGFGCRAVEEIHSICNKDILKGPLTSNGEPEYLELAERITKTRRGEKNQEREVAGRVYQDSTCPEICPVKTILFYISKKTGVQNDPEFSFLLNPKLTAVKNPEKEIFWYSSNRMGKNKISKLLKDALTKSGVDLSNQKITATSARKSMLQTGAMSLVPGVFLSKYAGQKSVESKLEYIKNHDSTHKATSLTISRGAFGVTNQTFDKVLTDVKNDKENIPIPKPPRSEYPAPSSNQNWNSFQGSNSSFGNSFQGSNSNFWPPWNANYPNSHAVSSYPYQTDNQRPPFNHNCEGYGGYPGPFNGGQVNHYSHFNGAYQNPYNDGGRANYYPHHNEGGQVNNYPQHYGGYQNPYNDGGQVKQMEVPKNSYGYYGNVLPWHHYR